MKKLLKIPALLFAVMLIVSSCGRNANDDAETYLDLPDDIVERNYLKLISKAQKADGKKQIKLYEEAADMMEDFIEMHEYYMKDKDNYEKLVEAMEEVDEDRAEDRAEEMGGSYKEYKKIYKIIVKDFKSYLEEVNDKLEELKEDD